MAAVKNELPLYVKISHYLVIIISIVFILYIGSEIILPLLFATLFAILLNPVLNFLQRKQIPQMVAILIVITLSMLLIAGFFFFLLSQISSLSTALPMFKAQLNLISLQTIYWISAHFNISVNQLEEWLNKILDVAVTNTTSVIGQTIMSISDALIILFLMPVYVFMILYYKSLIMEFISKVFTKEKHENIGEILYDSKILVQSYLLGLLIESGIVAALNTIGLLAIGVEFAILLGILSGLLNIIPYIGGVVAVVLPMVVALTTQSVAAAGWVLLLYLVVQFIDNNFIMTFVVASKVKINALASVIVVVMGAALWGIPGMFLSIPLTAILKVIFDRVDALKHYGFLLGDAIPAKQRHFIRKKLKPETKVIMQKKA